MNRQFYSMSFLSEYKENHIDEMRIQTVLECIGRSKRVLDLGCRDGYIMEKIAANNNVVEGIEISDPGVKIARKKGFVVYQLSLDSRWNTKIQHQYDVVFAGEIIEHIFDTDAFLQNIKSVLGKKGKLVISTPNLASLGRRISLLFGKNPIIETTARSTDVGHIRYFTYQTLKKLLKENNFVIEYFASTVVNFHLQGKWYSKILARLFPTLGNTLIIMAKKENVRDEKNEGNAHRPQF